MSCLGHCKQGRRPCPTPIQCDPEGNRYQPYIIGTLAFCLIVVIGLVLLILSLR